MSSVTSSGWGDEHDAATRTSLDGLPEAFGPHRLPGVPIFAPNDLLAGRFRVVRFVAVGGAGEVYEAEDLELRERVAIKTIRSELARDDAAVERFRREIRLARKVTHPNVCRIFDIFTHQHGGPGGPDSRVVFLTMEFLAGETLYRRIRRDGRMTTDEAADLARQMAAALQAAHRVGVVHRDFKSKNVVLVNADDGVRAVVTDFGLATSDSLETSMSVYGESGGTPAYMAPEQVEGATVTAAADIYAFGVVLFEMVTGTWPFVADSALTTALKRLKEPAPSPRTIVPTIDERWEAAILRCLERDPERRFASTAEVIEALDGRTPSSEGGRAPAAMPSATSGKRWILSVAAAVLLVVVGALIWFVVGRRADAPPPGDPSGVAAPAEITMRQSVAVLGFKNLSGRPEAAWLSTALSEMLTTELAASERVRAVAGESVARVRVELDLEQVEAFEAPTLQRLRTVLGTDLVVVGSYVVLGDGADDRIRLDLRLQDAVAGETILAAAETGTVGNLFDLVASAGRRLRTHLRVPEMTPAESVVVRASMPVDPDAARYYAEGLDRLRVFDAGVARDLLGKAVAIEPSHAQARAALASALSALGFDALAREEAGRALEHASGLSREARLAIEGQYRELSREPDEAIEIYASLWRVFPDDPEHGLRLAAAQTAAGRPSDALETVDRLRRLPAPAGRDPRIDLAEATAAHELADFTRARDAARRAATEGAASGASLLVARAKLAEGSAMLQLGSLPEARAVFEEGRRLFSEAGDRGGVARAINNAAVIFYQQGDLESARKMYEEALSVAREIGDERAAANALNNVGGVLADLGQPAEAMRMWQQALDARRRMGDQRGVAISLNNLGNALSLVGRLPEARASYEESLDVRRQIGDRRGESLTLVNLADTVLELGDLDQAAAFFSRAVDLTREIENPSLGAYARSGMAEVERARGRFDAAREHLEAALTVRTELGEKGWIAETRTSLARLALAREDYVEAERLARQAVDEFEGLDTPDDQAKAAAVLARALAAQGKTADARGAIARVETTLDASENPVGALTMRVAVESARVDIGDAAPVAAPGGALRNALARASGMGLVVQALEARLVLGRALERMGEGAAAARELARVENEARQLGFVVLARQASRE